MLSINGHKQLLTHAETRKGKLGWWIIPSCKSAGYTPVKKLLPVVDLVIERQGTLYCSVPAERLKDGDVHMCLFSRSGYRPLINRPPSVGNLLLDITLCSISFGCRFVFC